MSLPKKHTLFWLPGDYSLAPRGSIVNVYHDPGMNDPLSGLTGDFLAARDLRIVVNLPVDNAALVNPDSYATRLEILRATLLNRNLTSKVWAILVGDEEFDRCNYGARLSWPVYAGMTRESEDMQARKMLLHERLSRLFTLTKQAFPTIPTMQMETMYCKATGNVGLWHPLCDNADIAGVDPYMPTDGWAWMPGSSSLTPTTPASPYYEMNCGWFVVGTPAGYQFNISGAYGYDRPVVVINQAFHDLAPTSPWRQLPSTSQIRWPFERFVNESRVIGIGYYGLTSVPGEAECLDQLPQHYATILGTLAEMAGGVPVPDPVARPLSGAAPTPAPTPAPPTPPPTTPTLVCRTDVYSDGSVKVTWPSGVYKTVTP